MFGLENLDGWKLLVLALLGVFIFGPDKLPKAIADGVKMLRTLRDMARNATGDLSRELGTDIQLEDLNPKALIRKHLLSEEDEQALRKPLEDLYRDVQSDVKGLSADMKSTAESVSSTVKSTAATAKSATAIPARPVYDSDAT
jgi:sec-independent protein translocase protein TatB